MRFAIYPGTFNPFHEGHADIIERATFVFDRVIVALGVNPDKGLSISHLEKVREAVNSRDWGTNVTVTVDSFHGLLANYVKEIKPHAIIRGLRNISDFEYERVNQYWNEDLGIICPTFYVISDRKLVHISSSAIRAVNMFTGKE